MCVNGELIGTHSSSRSPCTPNRVVVNRRPRIEHIMWSHRAAWSPLWWWPCTFGHQHHQITTTLLIGLSALSGNIIALFQVKWRRLQLSWRWSLFKTQLELCRKNAALMCYSFLLNVRILFQLLFSDSANKLQVISNGAIRMQLSWTCCRLARH